MRWFEHYLSTLHRITAATIVTTSDGNVFDISEALDKMWEDMCAAHSRGNKVMFIGNGGSAGICSHSAIDYCNSGGIRALAFNDGAALTCLGNDYNFDQVFSRQIGFHGQDGDILVAISSSGRSADIINGCEIARQMGCAVYTLSGFDTDNPLRKIGDTNIFLESHEYGFVELGHQTIIHAVLDRGVGWKK